MTATSGATKARLRAQLLDARRAMSTAQRDHAASRITRFLLELIDVRAPRCLAAYYSFGTEPSTAELLGALRSHGVRVLLPVLRADRDLDWAIYDGPDRGAPGRLGLWTPDGPGLGVAAVAEADLVVAPALAVGANGVRLGRGGGSYDQALARVPADRLVLALLYDGELLPDVPADPHDRSVDAAVTPSGVHWFPAARGRP